MNDPSEGSYMYEKIERADLVDTDETNSCYILSCCPVEKTNDFNMLRLYGDDGKGVCIVYDVNYCAKGFFLAPVSYPQSEKGDDPKLQLVKTLLDTTIHDRSLKLNFLHIWSHFFKPKQYSEEQEVRLLYFNRVQSAEPRDYGSTQIPPFTRTWIYDERHGIAAPIVAFDITDNNNHFPLVIRQIILGPKAREAEVNVEQLKCLLRMNNIYIRTREGEAAVDKSEITNYR